jgi:histidinol-phosphate aminotransferase
VAGISRRQLLLGGGALVGAGFVPGLNLVRSALGDEIPRPDYMIRMGTNENPWGPSRVAIQAINRNLYRSSTYGVEEEKLVRLVAGINNVAPNHVAIGSGSGEILKTAALIATLDRGSIVCADPTYHDLTRYAEGVGADVIRVPVDDGFAIDLDALRKAIRKDTSCVYLVNPNNPIPSIIEKNALREFVLEVSQDRMVFVDEAYFEFVEHPDYASMMELIRDGHKNIIVARTASKIHGLAGLRVGFGFAHPDLIREINNRKTGDVNALGVEAAYASYQDKEFQQFTIRKNKESLAIVEGMHEELGHRYVKSNANFSFFETGRDVRKVGATFRKQGIMVGRPFPPMMDWLRVSMAKPDEMRYFVQTYKTLYA